MLEALGLGGERHVLPRLRGHALDLFDTVAQRGRLLRAFAAAALDVRHALLNVDQPVVCNLVCGERLQHVRAGVAVQGGALPGSGQQPMLVALPVYLDQRGRELGQHGGRHCGASGEGSRPPVRTERPADEQRPRVELTTELIDPGVEVVSGVQCEPTLDHHPVGVAANQRGVRAITQEQTQPGHHHGLARAGLARDHVEPGIQLERGVVDHAEPPDPQFFEQVRSSSIIAARATHRRAGQTSPRAGR